MKKFKGIYKMKTFVAAILLFVSSNIHAMSLQENDLSDSQLEEIRLGQGDYFTSGGESLFSFRESRVEERVLAHTSTTIANLQDGPLREAAAEIFSESVIECVRSGRRTLIGQQYFAGGNLDKNLHFTVNTDGDVVYSVRVRNMLEGVGQEIIGLSLIQIHNDPNLLAQVGYLLNILKDKQGIGEETSATWVSGFRASLTLKNVFDNKSFSSAILTLVVMSLERLYK